MRRTGIQVLAIMGLVWWIGGLWRGAALSPLLVGAGVLVAASLVAGARGLAADTRPVADRRREGRIVGMASAGEGVAIFFANLVLVNIGRADDFPCAIAIIVGLHFFPLARGLGIRSYFVTGPAMVAAGVAGCYVAGLASRGLFLGAACAACLWLTATWILASARRVPGLAAYPSRP